MSESPGQDSSLMKAGQEDEDEARMTSKPSTVTSSSKEESNEKKNQDDKVQPENEDATERHINFVQTDITAQTTRSIEEKDSSLENQYVQQRAMRNVMSWRPPTPPPSSSSPTRETKKPGSEKKWKTLGVGVPSLFQRDKQKPISPSIVPMLTGDEHSLYLSSNQEVEQDEQKIPVKVHRNRKQNAHRITNVIQSMISGSDSHDSEQKEDDTYQMMKSQHGSKGQQQHKRKLPSDQASFFYSGIEQLERERQERNDAFGQSSTIPSPNIHPTSSSYFNHQTRRQFIQQHTVLNANYSVSSQEDSEDKDEWHDDDFDLTTLFQFGSSPQSRDRHEKRQREMQRAPIVADIRKSSLSYMRQGRIQMRVPTDNVRLVMDEFLDGGILSVECDDQYRPLKVESDSQEEKPLTTVAIGLEMIAPENSCMNDQDLSFDNDANMEDRKRSPLELHDDECMEQGLLSPPIQNDIDRNRLDIEVGNTNTTRPPDLRYILTVDQDLYKRVLSEITHSRAPCGLYNCCHEAGDGSHQHVHISVALIILFLVFTLLLWGTIEFPIN